MSNLNELAELKESKNDVLIIPWVWIMNFYFSIIVIDSFVSLFDGSCAVWFVTHFFTVI